MCRSRLWFAGLTCGTDVYINFDFDSAAIRPESEQVVADVYRSRSGASSLEKPRSSW